MSNTFIIGELNHKIQRAKENLFTGILAIGTNTEVEWFLYFLVGQIVWANTRTHSQRRWHRQSLKYSPNLRPRTINQIAHHPQNYKTMAQLVMQQKFSREQFSQIVVGCISEVLFDIIHQATLAYNRSRAQLVYKVSTCNGANFPCIGLHRAPVWDRVQQDWQAWQQAKLVDYCPNLAPVIVRADILKERIPETTFRDLGRLANGQQTLRDLAVKTGHPLVALTQALVPHIRRDLIKLITVSDLSASKQSQQRSTGGSSTAMRARSIASRELNLERGKGVVAYVDDNTTGSQIMADIFQESEYRYVNISDPLQALAKLLELKPQLIFLDLIMPIVNGHELCAQIRRIPALQDIPIIIITNSNRIPDRLRARVSGANGFLGKPIQPKHVLRVVLKHLPSEPIAPSSNSACFCNGLQPSV